MRGQIVVKSKGSILDSEEFKIAMATEGIDDIKERLKANVKLSGDAIKRIEEKILDAIYISEIDLPYYIMALECLTEVLKEAINGMGDETKKAMNAKLEVLRSLTDIGIVTTETKE